MNKHGFMFFVLAVACVVIGGRVGSWGWPIIWFGMNCLILAFAYLCRFHRVFGKRPNGTLPFWSWFLFLPYFAYSNIVWNLIRFVTRERAYNQVSPNLIVGRRLLGHEIPGDVLNYIDLTAEFTEPTQARNLNGYLCLPILDAGAPNPELLLKTLSGLKPGKTFVHCAQGHGRTGLFAVAILLASRAATSVDEAISVLQSTRPGIRLNAEQRSCVRAFAQLALKNPSGA